MLVLLHDRSTREDHHVCTTLLAQGRQLRHGWRQHDVYEHEPFCRWGLLSDGQAV